MNASNALKRTSRWIFTFVLLGSAVSTACPTGELSSPVHAASHHLVLFGGSVNGLETAVQAAGGTVDRVWEAIGVARVLGLSRDAATRLARTAGIRSVQRDIDVQWIDGFTPGKTVAVQYAPETDGDGAGRPTFASVQWNMQQIDAGQGRSVTRGVRGVRVGLLSTGISPEHIDLQGRYDLNASVNLSTSNPSDLRDYRDRQMQGTILSALVSSNSLGIESVSPNVTLVGIKVFNDEGRASVANIIDGIMYAADAANTDIINIGIDHAPVGDEHLILMEMLNLAVRHAIDNGILVVAAVGNCGERAGSAGIARSFATAGALLIGASLRAEDGGCGAVACYGGSQSDISLYAPGGGLNCTDQTFGSISDMVVSALSPELARRMELPQPDSWYVFSSSAGVASAHVAGVAALLRSMTGPTTPAALVNRLLRSARQPNDTQRRGELSASFAATR